MAMRTPTAAVATQTPIPEVRPPIAIPTVTPTPPRQRAQPTAPAAPRAPPVPETAALAAALAAAIRMEAEEAGTEETVGGGSSPGNSLRDEVGQHFRHE
jgi:hypothetical protein